MNFTSCTKEIVFGDYKATENFKHDPMQLNL